MNYREPTWENKEKIEAFQRAYGENSCQHSFVASYCMYGKYGDQFCVEDDVLFTLRSRRGKEGERIYLFPLCDPADEDKLEAAVEKVLADAAGHGCRARFETITERAADFLARRFPGRFAIREERDLAEYIYSFDKLAHLPGHEMRSKRYDLHTFERNYEGRFEVRVIKTEEEIAGIRRFQEAWIVERVEHEEDVQLELEHEAITCGLDHFFDLGLSGILLYVDGELAGYAYGGALSDDCYDVMIEKGNREIQDIYRVLNRDIVRLCCEGTQWINREEDLGVEGLRKAKLSYKPDILLKKYIAVEGGAL